MELTSCTAVFKRLWRYRVLILITLPGVIFLILQAYVPFFGIVLAFKRYLYANGILSSPWVGLRNFRFLFATTDAFLITRNTLLYNLSFIVLNAIVPVALAILFTEMLSRFLSKLTQSVILFPNFLSMVIVSYLVYAVLNPASGWVNARLLAGLGIGSVPWYTAKPFWPFILVFVQQWHSVGYLAIIYLASITAIDPELYECAAIEGASKLQQVRSITIPCLRPTIVIMILLGVGSIFYGDFGLFFQVPLNSGPLFPVTQVIDTYVYRALFESNNIGMAAAAALYQSFFGFLLVLACNFVVRRIDPPSAIF